MKRKKPRNAHPRWTEKLDPEGLQSLLAYKLKKQIEQKYKDPAEMSALFQKLRTWLPAVGKEEVEVSQAAIDALRSAGLSFWPNLKEGRQKLPAGTVKFLSNVDIVTTMINDAEFSRLIPVTGGFV